jgi:hypothetical protein
MASVNFAHAFERWYELTGRERAHLEAVEKKSPVASWEGLDHLCGLAVESGMKTLLFRGKMVSPDPKDGDYPKDNNNRRPHVDELFNVFVAKVGGRTRHDWLKRLAGGKGSSPVPVFNTWKPEHRYAPDGTVNKTIAFERLAFAKRLKHLIDEEGAA